MLSNVKYIYVKLGKKHFCLIHMGWKMLSVYIYYKC